MTDTEQTVVREADGTLWTRTPDGQVWRSVDEGVTWTKAYKT